MTPELTRQWLADGVIDLREAVELLNQLNTRPAPHEGREGAAAIMCYNTIGAVPMINSF